MFPCTPFQRVWLGSRFACLAGHFVCLAAVSLFAPQALAQAEAFTVAAWGDNSFSQLNVPLQAKQVAQIAAGGGHGLALLSNGQLLSWGRNDAGQANLPAKPAQGQEPLRFYMIAAGARHSFALSNYGLMSWGAVTAVPPPGAVEAIAAGGDFNLVLAYEQVHAAGGNAYGQINVPAAAQSDVAAIAAGGGHALALKWDGTVVAWGKNDFGQATVPANATQIFKIAAGRDFSVALRTDGVMLVWGRGADSYLVPPRAAGGASKVAAGENFIVAENDTEVVAWGAPGAPVQVLSELRPTTMLAAGSRFALAVHAPYFTKLPGVVHVKEGAPASLTAAVSHTTGLITHWDNSTQTSSLTLDFPSTWQAMGHEYTLTASYDTGYSMTATGAIIVMSPPKLAEFPPAVSAAHVNESSTFWVDASGSAPMTFQWRKDGQPIPGANTEHWTLVPVKESDAGVYDCVVSNIAGEVTSPSRTLVVLPQLNGRERGSAPVELGASVALRFDPQGRSPPYSNFIWTKDDIVIPGASGPELAIESFTAQDAGKYKVTYQYTQWSETYTGSTSFSIYPPSPPRPPFRGWLVPSYALIKSGTSPTIQLAGVPEDDGTFYQWNVNAYGFPSENRTEADLTSLSLEAFQAPDWCSIFVAPHNTGDPTSLFAVIVSDDTPRTPGQLLSRSGPSQLMADETGEFAVEVFEPGGPFVWTRDGVVIPGQTSSTLIITPSGPNDGGVFEVRWPNQPSDIEVKWDMSVMRVPVIESHPQNTTLDQGPATLSVALHREPFTSYVFVWFRDGEEYHVDDAGYSPTSTLTTNLPGTYVAKIYSRYGRMESEAAVVEPGSGSVAVIPGVYLDGFGGAAYVRPDRSVVIGAHAGAGLVWLGETQIDPSGRVSLPAVLRQTSDNTPLAGDATLPFTGQFTASGVFTGSAGPNRTINTTIHKLPNRRHEGFYRGKVPGTSGEIWVFVTAEDQVKIYLHDGYAFYNRGPFDTSHVQFSPSGDSLTYNFTQALPYGRSIVTTLVALRDNAIEPTAKLSALAIRSLAGTGDRTLIAGFVLNGSSSRETLLRAGGPSLKEFGVSSPVEDPRLLVFRGSTAIAENDDWGSNASELGAAFTRLGTAAFKTGSKDAAWISALQPGAYTTHVTLPDSATPGESLIEIYDGGGAASGRLVALSSRTIVRRDDVAIVGFVIAGTGTKRVLIRAAGPSLSELGVTDILSDPKLVVYQGSTAMLENDNWSATTQGSASLSTAAAKVGAFPLIPGSRDAALLLDLPPGAYTAHAQGRGENTEGVVLIEVYEVP